MKLGSKFHQNENEICITVFRSEHMEQTMIACSFSEINMVHKLVFSISPNQTHITLVSLSQIFRTTPPKKTGILASHSQIN